MLDGANLSSHALLLAQYFTDQLQLVVGAYAASQLATIAASSLLICHFCGKLVPQVAEYGGGIEPLIVLPAQLGSSLSEGRHLCLLARDGFVKLLQKLPVRVLQQVLPA